MYTWWSLAKIYTERKIPHAPQCRAAEHKISLQQQVGIGMNATLAAAGQVRQLCRAVESQELHRLWFAAACQRKSTQPFRTPQMTARRCSSASSPSSWQVVVCAGFWDAAAALSPTSSADSAASAACSSSSLCKICQSLHHPASCWSCCMTQAVRDCAHRAEQDLLYTIWTIARYGPSPTARLSLISSGAGLQRLATRPAQACYLE